jgi:serine/threonine protein kinase
VKPDRLLEVALSLTDGHPVDWESAGVDVSASDRAALARLRQLEALGRLHAVSAGTAADAHDSIDFDSDEGAAPLRWGPLEIIEQIGGGSYGDVYRARDARLGRDVALKLLRHRDLSSDADVIREGHLLARIRHPNVVTIYGATCIDGRVGLWMELLRGETLEQELRRRGPFSASQLRQVAVDLCSAVHAVHSAGMLHRDIKAQNVMRAEDGRVVLTDFGTGSDAESAFLFAGTPAYLAPEVLAGGAPSVASDLYAVGVLLFHLATGSFPVDGSDIPSLLRAHRTSGPKSLATVRPDLPRGIRGSIDRALAIEPSARPASVAHFRDCLLQRSRPQHVSSRVLGLVALPLSVVALVTAVVIKGGRHNRGEVPQSVTLTQIPASIQRRFSIQAPSWEGSLATCTPFGRSALSLCNLTDGSIRAVRTPALDRERSGASYLSPDGHSVAYTWIDGTSMSLRLIGAGGSGDRELVGSTEPLLSFAGWNRSGRAIVFTTGVGDGACTELLEIKTGRRQKLRCVTDRIDVSQVALSADDRYLAYTRAGSPGAAEDIWILDRVTGIDRPVENGMATERDPAWTPDGRALIFLSNRLGTWGLFLHHIDNGVPRGSPQLVRDFGRSMPGLLGFTRDGTLFVVGMTDLQDVLRAYLDPAVPSLGNPERAEPTALDDSNQSPDWSPDGQRFAYIAGPWRAEGARIVIARAHGGVEKVLTFPGMPSALGKVRWSPSGRMLAVTAGLPGPEPSSTLDVVDSTTGDRHRVLTGGRIVDLRWAPDGNSIYFLSSGAIWSVDLRSASAQVVYRPKTPWMIDRFATFDLSRDGTALLMAIRSPGVVPCAARIVTTAGEVRDLPPFARECRAVAWTGNEQGVLAGVHAVDDSIPIFMVPRHGGVAPTRLQSLAIQVVDISVNPADGREVLLGTGNPRPDMWMVSGFTPAAR